LRWNPAGVLVCPYPSLKIWRIAVPDDNGGVIAVWNDWRNSISNIYAGKVDSSGIVTGVEVNQISDTRPTGTTLLQNYPNPFNPSTTIRFSLEHPEHIRLTIHNVLGEVVRVLIAGEYYTAGEHEIVWNSRDENNRTLASGIYFCRLQSREGAFVKKLCDIR
jgi:hypothetical protein